MATFGNRNQLGKTIHPSAKPARNPIKMGESQIKRSETSRQRYKRLLAFLSAEPRPVNTDDKDPPEDIAAYEELLRGDFISGETMLDQHGEIYMVRMMRISVSGRLFLEDLQKKEELGTSWGLIKHNRFGLYKLFAAFTFGILSALIGKALVHYFWPSE